MRKFFTAFFVFSALSAAVYGQSKTAANSILSDLSLTALDGRTYTAANLRGKVVVVNLWFISCPNCIEEIKLLNSLVDENQTNKNVVFLGLATNKKADLDKFLKKNPFKYQIVPESMQVILTKFATPDSSGRIDVPFPMHFVIDREGQTVLQVKGIKGVEAVRKELAKQFNGK